MSGGKDTATQKMDHLAVHNISLRSLAPEEALFSAYVHSPSFSLMHSVENGGIKKLFSFSRVTYGKTKEH